MKELSEMELKVVEGGFAWIPVLAVIGVALTAIQIVAYVVDNWESVEAGFDAGREYVRKN